MKKIILLIILSALIISCKEEIDPVITPPIQEEWTNASSGLVHDINVIGLGKHKIFAAANTTIGGIVYSSADTGRSWQLTDWNIQTSGANVKEFASDANKVAVVTDEGVALSYDDGVSWTLSSADGAGNNILLRGSMILIGTDLGGIKFSTDNGSSWNNTNYSSEFIFDLADNGLYVFASGKTNYIPYHTLGVIRSLDGRIWEQTPMEIIRMHSLAANENYLYGGGPEGFFYSADQGWNWDQLPFNNLYVRKIVSYSDIILIAGSNTNNFYISKDNGNSWIQKSNGIQHVLSILIFKDYVFVNTQYDKIWKHSFNGLVN